MNDTEEEDLALYGAPVPDTAVPIDAAAVPPKDTNQNEKEKPDATNADPDQPEDQTLADKHNRHDPAGSVPNSMIASELKAQQTPARVEGDVHPSTTLPDSSITADVPVVAKESGGSQPSNGFGDQGGEMPHGDASAQNKPQQESEKHNGEGAGKDDDDGESGDEGDEVDDSDDDDDEDDDEDSEDDDFDVILNYDEADTQPKVPHVSSGSIGKVRLPSNKWQRPGYVPPERVIGVPTQGAARTGGVLSMLPTPTMQIGGSQKSVYDLEIGKLTEKPWLDRNADLYDYFNYGFNEETWKLYCERQKQMRLEASMLAKIKTVDGNKSQAAAGNRPPAPGSPKQIPSQAGALAQPGAAVANRGGQNKPQQQGNQPLPPRPPGMMPPLGFEGPPGGMLPIPPGMEKVPNMPKMPPGMPPNMPFPFPPGAPNPKGGNFQPPFPPFIPLPGGQRSGDGKGSGMFPMLPPGMPGLPPGMPMPPGGMPPGVGRGGGGNRGFPGELQTPQKLQPPQSKNGQTSGSGQGTPEPSHREEQKRPGQQGHQGSRFGNVQNNQQRPQQSNRPPHHEGDRRQRWNDNRGHGDRRQGYDRQSSDRERRTGGYEDRGYADRGDRGDRADRADRADRGDRGDRADRGDRGYERRRWGDRDDGYDRRRGGHDSQRYSDNRRDYDRDTRDRDYRKRSSSGRDYEEDRKRTRR